MRKRERKIKETFFFFFNGTCRDCQGLVHSTVQYCLLEAKIFTLSLKNYNYNTQLREINICYNMQMVNVADYRKILPF